LRGLASLGVFAESETEPRSFVLTPLAELLRSDHPGSLRQFVRMLGGEHYDAWTDLLHSIRSGESASRHLTGAMAPPMGPKKKKKKKKKLPIAAASSRSWRV
jgi:hypothetical protein